VLCFRKGVKVLENLYLLCSNQKGAVLPKVLYPALAVSKVLVLIYANSQLPRPSLVPKTSFRPFP